MDNQYGAFVKEGEFDYGLSCEEVKIRARLIANP